MATDESKIIVKLEAEISKLSTNLNSAQKKISRFEKNTASSVKLVRKSFKSLGTGIQAALGGLALAKLTRSVVSASIKQEQALAQLEQGYRTTGGVVGQTVEQMVAKAEELQGVTIFGDEQFIEAQAQLLTFTNIAGEQFNKTTEAAANLSVRMGQDLKSSVVQLGKALNDPVANLGALSRSGIQFSKDQKAVIKSLAETGRLADAQNIILKELETQFGGSARAARDTFGGALTSLNNAFGDLLEGESGLNEAKKSLEEFTALLQDPQTIKAASALTSSIIDGMAGVAKVIREVITLTRTLAEEFAAKTNGPADVGRINDRIAQLQATIDQLDKASAKLLNEDGKASAPDVYNAYTKQIEDAEKELNKLIDLRDSYFKKPLLASGPSSAPTATTPLIEPNKTTSTASPSIPLESAKFEMMAKESSLAREVEQIRIDSLTSEQQAVEELQGKYRTLAEAVELGNITQGEAAKVAGELAARFEEANETVDEMSEYAKQAARNMQDAFADFLFDPFEDGLDGMLQNFVGILQRMAAEAAAAQIFDYLGGLASASGNSTVAAAGALFQGGARAWGGPVSPGMKYPVGEKGPEMFVPNVAGSIIPADEMGGGTQIGNITMSFPGINNAQEAKRASGVAGRELARNIDGARRYS